MTNEELDEARAKEARRIHYAKECPPVGEDAIIAARLAREGWTPPEPVDPDLLAVREIVAKEWESKMFPHHADAARKGRYDAEVSVRAALAAYKASASRFVASDLLESGNKQTAILRAAQEILTRYLVPDGLDASQALCTLLALLDGPEQRSAQSSWDAAIAAYKAGKEAAQ